MHDNINCTVLCEKSFLQSVDALRIISGAVTPLVPASRKQSPRNKGYRTVCMVFAAASSYRFMLRMKHSQLEACIRQEEVAIPGLRVSYSYVESSTGTNYCQQVQQLKQFTERTVGACSSKTVESFMVQLQEYKLSQRTLCDSVLQRCYLRGSLVFFPSQPWFYQHLSNSDFHIHDFSFMPQPRFAATHRTFQPRQTSAFSISQA